jgi:DNA-binding winged helix-turn-helix (wHTH) protein
VKRKTLTDWIWQGIGERVEEDALTVAVKRLRDQLEIDAENPDYIKNVYDIGYTWAVNP